MRRIKSERDYLILHPDYNGHVDFYVAKANGEGANLRGYYFNVFGQKKRKAQPLPFENGLKVVVCDNAAIKVVQEAWRFEVLVSHWACKLIRLTGKK